MENYERYFDTNKSLWNAKTKIHTQTDFYGLADFKKGKTVLTEIELKEIGSEVKGKSLLHLQCHFGMDTLDWQRRGAKCVGVDFSEEAIKEAQKLAAEMQLKSRFICANIYDLKDHLTEKFDIIFTSYGTIGWLPDLDKWAKIISHFLKDGSIFYMADFHPVIWMFDSAFSQIEYSYFNREVIEDESVGTYADRTAEIKHKEYGWNHSVSEILSALLNNNLRLTHFHEFDFAPYNCFQNLTETETGKWQIKGLEGKMPMVYSIKAEKNLI